MEISIIIPTYNSEKFIKRAIESVLSQTFQDFEIIIVDDFSQDNTVTIVKELQNKDGRIKLLCLDRNSGGPAHPKNEGFKISKGEFIAYLDHDDEWFPDKLEKQMNLFKNSQKKNLGLVFCGANFINDNNKNFGVFVPVKKENLFPEILLNNPIYSNSSVLIKRKVVEVVGSRDIKMKYSEDWDMWIRVAKAGYGIDFVFKPLFNYYLHKENVTKTSGEIIKIKDVEYVLEKHRDLYLKYNYLHIGFFRLGVMYLIEGDSKKSKEHFLKSIKNNKTFIFSYFGLILSSLSLVGVVIFRFFIYLYHFSRNRKYLFIK